MEEVLKHVSTRWLSMERCVGRTLSQWPALQAYFNSSDDKEKPGHVKRCADAYASEEMKLMYYFLQYALTKLNKFNILFQVSISLPLWVEDYHHIIFNSLHTSLHFNLE